MSDEMKRTVKQILAIAMIGLMILTVNGTQRKLGQIASNTYITAEDVTGAQLPIGFIFMSTSSTNPATLLGYGTWTAVGAGKVLVGYAAGDPDFGTPGASVGAKTVTSTGSVAAPTFTGSSAAVTGTSGTEAAHTHSVTAAGTNGTGAVSGTSGTESAHTHSVTAAGTVAAPVFTGNAVAAASTNATPDLVTSNTGGSGVSPVTTATGTNSAPAFTGSAVTSGAGSSHSHGAGSYVAAAEVFTGSAVTSGAGSSHSHGAGSYVTTAAGTNSAPTYTGNATSVIQPSLVVYMFERTA